jgi:hypothetical protein
MPKFLPLYGKQDVRRIFLRGGRETRPFWGCTVRVSEVDGLFYLKTVAYFRVVVLD